MKKKRKKIENLTQVVESLTEDQTMGLSMSEIIDQKFTQICDSLTTVFEGISFLAPLDIIENSNLGAISQTKLMDIDNLKFIRYYWSSNMKENAEHMRKMGFDQQPLLQKASTFKHSILSRRVILLHGKKLNSILPKNHFKITHMMLVPVVVNKITVALVALGNGIYTEQDSELLFDLLPKFWSNVVLESIKVNQKEEENENRLIRIAKRVEETQSITKALQELDTEEIDNVDKEKLLLIKLTKIADFFGKQIWRISFNCTIKS